MKHAELYSDLPQAEKDIFVVCFVRALGSRHKRPYYVSISVSNASGIKHAALLVVTSELRSCVAVEVAVVGAPSITVRTT